MKIEEYIKTLIPQEREQHKDLIKECLEKEKNIAETGIQREESLKKLETLERRMYDSILKLQEAAALIKENLQNAYKRIPQQKKEEDPLGKLIRTNPELFYKV